MTRRRPAPIEEPDKAFSDMAPAERIASLCQMRREVRADQVRMGARPRSMRDFAVWHETLAEEDRQAGERTARAERRQQPAGTGQEKQSDE